MITCWTDYPFVALGDAPGQKAPIRLVTLISYDGDKYAKVKVCDRWIYVGSSPGAILTFTVEDNAVCLDVKAGYLYAQPGRFGQVEQIDLHNFAERLS